MGHPSYGQPSRKGSLVPAALVVEWVSCDRSPSSITRLIPAEKKGEKLPSLLLCMISSMERERGECLVMGQPPNARQTRLSFPKLGFCTKEGSLFLSPRLCMRMGRKSGVAKGSEPPAALYVETDGYSGVTVEAVMWTGVGHVGRYQDTVLGITPHCGLAVLE